jgi:ureidoacrylate peracid hydrolase
MAAFLDKIDPKRTALLLIEYQNEFATEGGKLHPAVEPVMKQTNMLANSKSLMDAAREKGIKIVHSPITFSDDYRELSNSPYGILGNVKGGQCFLASAWGGAICDTMTPASGDIIIAGKRGLCAFASTNLDFILRQNGIETLAIGGFLTNCCVESSMRTAYEKGYNVITLTDCCAATSPEQQVLYNTNSDNIL